MIAAHEEAGLETALDAIRRTTGIDFRPYARSTLLRRIRDVGALEGGVAAACERALRDPAAMARLVAALCVSVTALFRDPSFHLAFRERALPLLRDRPTLRLWHAGCATGEEVYSMAILLHEAGLYERARLYGTDVHEDALRRARGGLLPLELMREYTRNYQRAGGSGEFSAYYLVEGEEAVVRPALRAHVHFARHDLATGGAFAEFDAVVCRNVLIYFEEALKERVHRMFLAALPVGGVLALGHAEAVPRAVLDAYDEIDARERIYLRAR